MKNNMKLCPCCSGTPYTACCQPFHQGGWPDNALKLMRSRYSAYALCLPDYIIRTTHPENPQFCHDATLWSQQISEFCLHTQFRRLEILDFQENDAYATVTFVAHLTRNNRDASFKEKSRFEKIEGQWLYLNGQLDD
jgi:SEC-C motif domain protein